MSNWKPFRGQVSLVSQNPPGGEPPPNVSKLYEFVWKETPQSFQQVVTNPLQPAVATATVNGLIQSFTLNPNRIDGTIASPGIQGPNDDVDLQLADNWDLFWEKLDQVVTALASDDAPIPAKFDRAAVFVQALSREPSYVEVNKALVEAMPNKYRIPLTNEEGFVLQFVQPHPCAEVRDLSLNAVQKWSAELFQVVRFASPTESPTTIGGTGNLVITSLVPQISKFYCASLSVEANSGTRLDAMPPGSRQVTLRNGIKLVKDAIDQLPALGQAWMQT